MLFITLFTRNKQCLKWANPITVMPFFVKHDKRLIYFCYKFITIVQEHILDTFRIHRYIIIFTKKKNMLIEKNA